MRRPSLTVVLFACVAGTLVGAAPAPACACGIALQADVVRERALVIQRGAAREEIVAGFDLTADGPDARAAVVLPVPGDPTVMAVDGDPLGYLDTATAPKGTAGSDESGGAAGGAAPPRGVDVIGRGEVGGYDVSRLRADDPDALNTWLKANGYTMPAGAGPILAGYVKRGWRYVAIRLAKGEQGQLKPLRVAFPTRQLVYPMQLSRLSDKPISLTLYVLAGAEQQTRVLSTSFAAPLRRLDPPPPAALQPLFAGGRYLTKLVAENVPAGSFTRDLFITTASASTATGSADAEGDDGGTPWGIVAGLAVVLLAAGGTAAARRSSR